MRDSIRIFGVLTIMVMMSWGRVDAKESRPKDDFFEGTIVALGDSLTEGFGLSEDQAYPAQLERKLLANGYRYRVVNAGISGETSDGALSRVKWVLNLKPDIVIVETGINDGFRGIPPERIEKNLTGIIRTLKQNNITVVLAGMQISQIFGASYAEAFGKLYERVAEEQGVIRIPFFLDKVALVPELNLLDGIHPNSRGYGIITDTVYPYVVEAIEKTRQKAE